MASKHWPLFDLVVRTPKLELRYPDDELLDELIERYRTGVHQRGRSPFLTNWTEQASPQREWDSLRWWWRARAEMRLAALHLGFVGLGAEEARSEAMAWNAASIAVSRKAGYRENGRERVLRGGTEVDEQVRFVMTRERFLNGVRRDDIQLIGLDLCRELLGLGPPRTSAP
jgi:hypothetical protein